MLDENKLIEAMARGLAKLESNRINDNPRFGGNLVPQTEWYLPQAKAALRALINELPEIKTRSYISLLESGSNISIPLNNAADLYQQLKDMGK